MSNLAPSTLLVRRTGSLTRASLLVPVSLAVLLLYAALTFGIYNSLTSHQLGANDFYSRWMGARAFFLQGQNPYSDAVTRDIQMGMYGRLARPDEDQVAFAYPLYAAYLAAPLVALPYPLAQALWMAFLVLLVIAGAFALASVNRIPLSPLGLALLVVGALFFYPSVRGIFLGNYTLVSFAFMALCALAIAQGHDTAAGVFLALASVKPQPIVFLLPAILVWAWWNARRRVLWSALVALAALVISSFLFVPTWFTDFLNGLRKYAGYLPIGPPAETLWKLLVPSGADILTWLTSALLFLAMAILVWRNRGRDWFAFQPTLGFVALVTTLIAVRIGSPDQALLLILWLAWIRVWSAHKRRVRIVLAILFLLIVPWYVFLATVDGNQEALVVSTVLPWSTLAVFCVLTLLDSRRRGFVE